MRPTLDAVNSLTMVAVTKEGSMLRYSAFAFLIMALPALAGNFNGEDASRRWFDAKYLCESGKDLQSGGEGTAEQRDAACQEFAKLTDELKANRWCLDKFGSGWSRYCPDYSRRATAVEVRAFIAATGASSGRFDAVLDKMNERIALEEIVRSGVMKSVYDCIPELRVDCFDAIVSVYTGRKKETVFEEWGEWFDNTDDQGKVEFVSQLLSDAAVRGFDLLTDEELEAGKAP
jgi:hypothetical protein